jgi:subtilisin family serine protease
VIDSGAVDHSEFIKQPVRKSIHENYAYADTDVGGHGSHVSGLIAGRTVGGAPGVELISIQVMNMFGACSAHDIIKSLGIVSHFISENPSVSIVVNMSLGIISGPNGCHNDINLAIDELIRLGAAFSVAAGNSNEDACLHTPACHPGVMTFGATDEHDNAWKDAVDPRGGTNYGSCVNMMAPGHDVYSITELGGYKKRTGTSMATPLGSAALSLAMSYGMTATQAINFLMAKASRGLIPRATELNLPDLLLYIPPVFDGTHGPSQGDPPNNSPWKQDPIKDVSGVPGKEYCPIGKAVTLSAEGHVRPVETRGPNAWKTWNTSKTLKTPKNNIKKRKSHLSRRNLNGKVFQAVNIFTESEMEPRRAMVVREDGTNYLVLRS